MQHGGYVYILTSQNHAILYTGVTADLARRVAEHKAGQGSVFTSRYRGQKLVYYERFESIEDAIHREKEIKRKTRAKKIALIAAVNPKWNDLSV